MSHCQQTASVGNSGFLVAATVHPACELKRMPQYPNSPHTRENIVDFCNVDAVLRLGYGHDDVAFVQPITLEKDVLVPNNVQDDRGLNL
jgi:hypothetical protein